MRKTACIWACLLPCFVYFSLAAASPEEDLHEVRIRVVYLFGKAVPDVKLKVSVIGPDGAALAANQEQVLKLRVVPYDVKASSQGYLSSTRKFFARAQSEVWIVGLEEAPTHIPIQNRRLIVRRAQGGPKRVDEARLRSQYSDWSQTVPFDSSGEARFRGMPAGRYDLVSQNYHFEIARYVVDLEFSIPQVLSWDLNSKSMPAGLTVVRSFPSTAPATLHLGK